jgi:non-specific serine/threonine protein kinase
VDPIVLGASPPADERTASLVPCDEQPAAARIGDIRERIDLFVSDPTDGGQATPAGHLDAARDAREPAVQPADHTAVPRASPHQPPPPLEDGRFVFEVLLGRGGMGEVWRGRDLALDRVVALKLLREDVARSPAWRSGRWEGRAVARLDSPLVPRIHDILEEPGRTCLVLEYVPGAGLSSILAGGRRLTIESAVELGMQLARALDVAHRAGLAHRDVKPGNIVVARTADAGPGRGAEALVPDRRPPRATLVDWGLALGVPQWREHGPPERQHDRKDGSPADDDPFRLAGTPNYMAPEQLRGKAGRGSDMWGLGCVLFECLAGRRAFAGSGPHLVRSILDGAVPWEALPADVPPQLRRLLERCLLVDEFERIRDVGEALERFAETKSGAAPPSSARTNSVSEDTAERRRFDDVVAPFVGVAQRKELFTELLASLATEGATLLHGPPGVGTSWLARRAARAAIDDPSIGCTAGAIHLELQPAAPLEDVRRAVVRACDPRDEAARGDRESLRRRLRTLAAPGLLLVLDGLDARLVADADLLRDLLVPGLRLLATSSASTAGSRWRSIEVEPLELPQRHVEPTESALLASPAVAFFVDAVRGRRRSFRITAENAFDIVEVCRRVGGTPGALELVASQTAYASPRELLARLDRILAGSGDRRASEDRRRHGLARAIAASLEGLDEPAALFAERASIFAGDWTLDAAEAVVCDDALPSSLLPELLVELIDRSLVRIAPGIGPTRYRLLEIARAHGRVALARRGETVAVRRRLAQAVWGRLQASSTSGNYGFPSVLLASLEDWLRSIDRDAPDIVACLEELDAVDEDLGTAADAALVMQRWWIARGRYAEGRAVVDRLLRALDEGKRLDPLRALRLRAARGNLGFPIDATRALVDYRTALALERARIGDPHAVVDPRQLQPLAALLHNVGLCVRNADAHGLHADEAARLLVESLALWRRMDDQNGSSAVLLSIAIAAIGLRRIADRTGSGCAASLLSAALERDVPVAAVDVAIDEVLASLAPIFDRSGDATRAAVRRFYRAMHDLAMDRVDCAIDGACAVLALRRTIGDPEGIADALRLAALVAERLASTATDPAARRVLASDAARLFGAAEHRRACLGVELSAAERGEYESARDRTRTVLDGVRDRSACCFDACIEDGATLGDARCAALIEGWRRDRAQPNDRS